VYVGKSKKGFKPKAPARRQQVNSLEDTTNTLVTDISKSTPRSLTIESASATPLPEAVHQSKEITPIESEPTRARENNFNEERLPDTTATSTQIVSGNNATAIADEVLHKSSKESSDTTLRVTNQGDTAPSINQTPGNNSYEGSLAIKRSLEPLKDAGLLPSKLTGLHMTKLSSYR
jgi:hypothetical protein